MNGSCGLTDTAWDLEPFARDCGLNRDDTAYILDTFPIVRRKDIAQHGEYRTQRVILEIYDALAESTRTGKPYQTRLDPPPADPRVAHQPRSASQVRADSVADPG